MTAIETIIKESVEKGGYSKPLEPSYKANNPEEQVMADVLKKIFMRDAVYPKVFLDPLFWQALGKARGWGIEGRDKTVTSLPGIPQWDVKPFWVGRWHSFIDALASGGDAESFFKELV